MSLKPHITIARRACEAMGARQAIVVGFDGDGRLCVVSYGTTKAECAAVRPVCDAIFNALQQGAIDPPQAVGGKGGAT